MSTNDKKIKAMFLLHAFGDVFGFKNGEWEFTESDSYIVMINKISEFIDLGGINNIDLTEWNVSDDTILHLAIAKSISKDYNTYDELIHQTIKNLIESSDSIVNDNINRYIGNATLNYCNQLKKLIKTDNIQKLYKYDKSDNTMKFNGFQYNGSAGGNGAAMRTLCIGAKFHGIKNRKILINYTIDSSKLTHPNPIGWLGGLLVACFGAFAFENLNINTWLFEFLNLLSKYKVKENYCDIFNYDEIASYNEFIEKIHTYINTKFDEDKNIIKNRSSKHLENRLLMYNNMFIHGHKFGNSGLSACIIAYDCLIDAGNCWEKIIYYLFMNNYDTDSIGCIGCGLYGILYGIDNIPKNCLHFVDYKQKINNIIKRFKI